MNLIERARQFLARRRTAYVKTFQGPFGEEVLADLAKFCRANQSTFHSDPRVHAVAEGRREVWLRISQHLNLTDDQLWRMYGQPTRTELNNNE
jgi:hypothetical protein